MSETTGNLEQQKVKTVKTLATMLDYLGLQADLRVSEKGSKIAITISSEEAGRIIGRKRQMLESFQTVLNRMMYNNDSTFPRVVLDIDGYPRTRGSSSTDGETPAPRNNKSGSYERSDSNSYERSDSKSYERSDSKSYERKDQNKSNNRRSSYEREDRRPDNSASKSSDEDTLKKQALDAAKEVKRWGDATTLPKMNANERRIIHLTLDGDDEIITASNGDGDLKNVVISLKK